MSTPKRFNILRLSATASVMVLALGITGCASPGTTRTSLINTAQNIAAPADMKMRVVKAEPFNITIFERIREPGAEAVVYVEGDGLAWLGRRTPSKDPTPRNPLALKLAALDPAPNVIYIARPCQYTKMANNTACYERYWTSARFAPEAVAALDKTLNDIQTRGHIPAFHLVGFSGGGAMAPLVAARRSDVQSVRTVAGNLDHETVNRVHRTSRLSGSLNARNVAKDLADIPQIHFIGTKDKVVTPEVYQSYLNAIPADRRHCIRNIAIAAEHEKGWAEAWPKLVQEEPQCRTTE